MKTTSENNAGVEYPLSTAQLGIWRDLQFNPRDVGYSIWDYIRIESIDVEKLIVAIAEVCSANDSFRLRFRGDAFNPRQIFSGNAKIEIAVLDFSSSPNPEVAALTWMSEDHRQPFDLHGNQLFRNAVLKLSTEVVYWYRNYHHLIADGFSMVMLGFWTAQRYRALVHTDAPEGANVDRIPKSYIDYLQAEGDYRRSPQYQIDKDFWTSLHSELPEPVSLSRKPIRHWAREQALVAERWLSSALQNGLYDLAAAIEVNVGHLLIAVVAAFVHKATGIDDIPICIPTHGRERGSTLEVVGMCTNTLVLRFKFDSTIAVSEILRSACADIAQAYEHRRYRYESLRDDLGFNNLDAVPFRIHANIIRTGERWKFGDKPVRVETMTAGLVHDLQIMIVESRTNRQHFRVALFANPSLYENWELDLHLSYFEYFLQKLMIDPRVELGAIRLTSASEQARLVASVNDTAKHYANFCGFHRMFEAQVVSNPGAIAIVHADMSFTYAELDIAANRLAHHICKLGIQVEDVIGVCFDRSPDMIIAILAILKAGAAFLPLDPESPESRLAFMVQDANVKIIVTHSSHELRLPDHLARLVFVDTMASDLAELPLVAPDIAVDTGQLAYVIYTSGSTGQPKGVLVQHDGLCNLAAAQAEEFGVNLGVRVLQFARLTFDASVSEIAMALASGGTLVLADKYALLPGNLTKTLAEKTINVVTLPPSILPSLTTARLPALRTLIVAGEPCPLDIAREWSSRCRFINAYGPTETTVCATFGIYVSGSIVSIGKPMANMRIYILDTEFKPVPVGIVGEIFVGGVGVSRGYINRPELTQEKFTADPFTDAPNSRLYRTGDLGRLLPNGTIEFVGRKDQQIKLRGFRIEIGEIEAALLKHPTVVECAVILRENRGRQQLIAYVVRTGYEGCGETSRVLRAFLRKTLPDYMIPSHIVVVRSVPRTHSGKIDRRALPNSDERSSAREYIPPTTDIERKLVRTWSEVLGEDQVCVTDNFLDLGGDSLAVLSVVALIRDLFAIEFPPQHVLEAPDLRTLAQSIEQRLNTR